PQDIQQLKGSLDNWPLETTVGILVANGVNRFTKDAVSEAQSSRHHIILVGTKDLIKKIRDYQPRQQNGGLVRASELQVQFKKELEKTSSEVQQLKSEIAKLRHFLISFSKNK
ncbi:6470_t:CDS:1, partial [Paraglomus occultum]